MSIRIELAHNCMQACEAVLVPAANQHERTVWLLPDYARALERRKALAHAASPLRFGCTVSSLSSWVEDLWSLYGDGRKLVSAIQRKLLMKQALEGVFPANQGTVDLLARMVEQGLGISAFIQLTDEGDAGARAREKAGLSPVELRMLACAQAYRSLLSKHGLAEASEAMLALSTRPDIAWPAIACEEFTSLRAHEAAFFAALSQQTKLHFVTSTPVGSQFDTGQCTRRALEHALSMIDGAQADADRTRISPITPAPADTATLASMAELDALRARLFFPDPDSPIAATGAVRAVLPVGRHAQSSLIAEEIIACAGSALVACMQPGLLFDELAPRLSAAGIPVEARFTRPFAETDFGGAFINALAIAEDEHPCPAQASDLAFSVFSGVSLQKAYDVDAAWRAVRLTSREDVLAGLRACSPALADFIELLAEARFAEALDAAEARFADCVNEGDAFRAEQYAAAKCVRMLIAEAESLGRTARELFDLLPKTLVRSSASIKPQPSDDATGQACPQVTIVSQHDTAKLSPASYDAVFVCDLNASDQTLITRSNAVAELFAKIGYPQENDALFRARLRLSNMLACARDRVVLVRSLNNAKTEPTYPAVTFEDVVECYRARVMDDKGQPGLEKLGKASALTSALEAFATSRGEEALEVNLYPTAVRKLTVHLGESDTVSQQLFSKLHEPLSPIPHRPMRMSPSAIENYLDCPHKWFASNRMYLSDIDASFSQRERGSFIHEVLYGYYHRLRSVLGTTKPDLDQLNRALVVLEEEFERALAAQTGKTLRENPYIPLTQAEHQQARAVLDALRGFVERDAAFARSFKPEHFEARFGYEEPFEYAGVLIRGSIDRIDVDENGCALIVDYKSSLSADYNLLASSEEGGFALPPKVQTLIYAQVARKLLGLQPVGALYVHTLRPKKGPQTCGAYDDRIFSKDELGSPNAKKCPLSKSPFSSFEDLLDATEALIAERLAALKNGDISVRPREKLDCTWCPVLSCERRS